MNKRLSIKILVTVAGVMAAVFIAAAALPGGAETANAATSGVSIRSFRFSPATITIQPGETVRWINDEDSVPHTVTSEKQGGFSSSSLKAGDSVFQTFPQAGAYNYFCAIHPSMRGVVLVGDAKGAPSTPPPPTPRAPVAGTGHVAGGDAAGGSSLAALFAAAAAALAGATIIMMRRRAR